MNFRTKGFTLIELLVVISIISLLSSVVLSAVNTAREKAQIARAKQELVQIAKSIVVAQGEGNKTLLQITGNGCSDCPCRVGTSLKGDTGSCYVNWINVLTTVQGNTNGIVTGLTSMTRDPWNSPYAVDENEGESGASDCRNDSLRSVGPNGVFGDSDDISILVPLKKFPCP